MKPAGEYGHTNTGHLHEKRNTKKKDEVLSVG